MALALTIRETHSNATDANAPDVTTDSFTPSNNSLLGVLVTCQNNGTNTTSPTISGGGLTYTSRAKARGGGNFGMWVELFTAPVTTGASMAVTVDNTTASFGAVAVAVVDLTGYDTTTPTGVNLQATTGARSGTYSPSLSGTSDSDSIVLIAGTTDSGTATKHASWTDIFTGSAAAGGTDHKFSMSYRSGALTTADWAALDSSFSTAAAAIEIKAADATGDGAGASAGAATVSGVGSSLADGVGASAGAATPSGVSSAQKDAAASSAGVGAANGVGGYIQNAVAASNGISTTNGVSLNLIEGAGASNGVAAVSGISSIVNAGVGASAGLATAQAVGNMLIDAVANSAGNAIVVGASESVDGVGLGQGMAIAQFVASPLGWNYWLPETPISGGFEMEDPL